MGNFIEPTLHIKGTDSKRYEMPIVQCEGYDYTNSSTASASKTQYGNPTLEQLGSLLCEHSKEISLLRNKPNFGYYANSYQLWYYTSLDVEDIESMQSIFNTIDANQGDKVDFLLSSPGGYVNQAIKLIDLINKRFSCSYLIYAPACSMATLMAISGHEIIFQQYGYLTPANPRINGFDTYIAKKVYRTHRLHKILFPWAANKLPEAKVAENNVTMDTLLSLESLVYNQANKGLCNLFKLKKRSLNLKTSFKINRLANFFTNYGLHNSHSASFYAKELQDIGLPCALADKELDKQMYTLNNICSELTTTKWVDGIGAFYVRKVYYSTQGWSVLKHRLTDE